MKKLLLALVLLFNLLSYSQEKQIFENPKMVEIIATHKLVAILPFKATIAYKKLPKGYNEDSRIAEEQSMSTQMQSGLYTYLLRKSDDYTVQVQDVDKTNMLLRKAGLYDKLNETSAEDIAQVLGVDAVIKCSYAYEKTGSEGAALVKTLLIGFGTGKVATGGLTMQVNNGVDGELVWRFYKQMAEDVLSSPAAMMERMMRKVGRNFPYEK
ncbi:hypothetical protein [Flavobacterium frigidarium]|uniref:hypothetical protein n=1 Tax=Flavobacterium frigidarium TaxID=99286 RepID=UPI0030D91620|tara:strand:- start:1980 stop:2612 length:633 start_codon:yes stop_codon:yes gene_type:complete